MKALSTGDQVIAQVITDASAAASLLPSKGDQSVGRVTSAQLIYCWVKYIYGRKNGQQLKMR
jgi:F420-0:gamma-glutamyl ligase-like protein